MYLYYYMFKENDSKFQSNLFVDNDEMYLQINKQNAPF